MSGKKKSEPSPEDVSVKARWKSGGFFTVPNRVYDQWGALLGINGFAVYCALARYANNDTNEAWMKQSTIAQRLGCTAELVGWALADIVELGLAERETHPRTTGFGVRHTYTLLPVGDPQEGTVAPHLKRDAERQKQRATLAEVENRLKSAHIPPPPEDVSSPSTKPDSSPSTKQYSLDKLNGLVRLNYTVRSNEDSLREEDSKRTGARDAPALSLLPGKEEAAVATNDLSPKSAVAPLPPAPSRPPSPPAPQTAGSSALASPVPSVEWEDVRAAPEEVRRGPLTFPDDVDGWCQALIWLTTGWTATKFFATKPKAEADKYWGQAKQHFQKGHHVPVLLDKYQPGGWWYTLNAWKNRRPTLHEISASWGDWDQDPVPLGPAAPPPPATPREVWQPPQVNVHTFTPEQTVEMRRKYLEEARRERDRKTAERQAQTDSRTVQRTRSGAG